jgi:hypothetical protein
MNKYKGFSQLCFLVFLLIAFVAGCASNSKEVLDTTAPTVSFTSPSGGDSAVPNNRKIIAGFSEIMDPATVNTSSFTLRETVSGTVVSGTVAPVGTSATFAPTASLKFSTNYTATIRGGSFGGVKDLAGNRMASDFVFSFSTGAVADTIAPTVSVTSPTSTAVDVPVNRKVTVGFSEAMEPSTITAVSFTLKETVGGANVPGTVTPVGTTAAFAPSAPLKFSTNYTATIKGGNVGGVKDLAVPGNAMAVDFTFTFTTGASADTVAPTVSVTSPTDTAVAVPVNRILHVGFSEEMDPATISTASFTLKEFVSNNNIPGTVTRVGTSATFAPLSPLTLSTKYAATIKGGTIGGVKDLAGNAMVADFVFTFTTGPTADATAPTLITTGALDGTTGVPVNRASTATFSEPMDPATLASPATSFTVKVFTTNLPVAGVVTYSGNTATFKPNSDLAPLTKYTSTISNSAKDLAGNALVSGLRANPWSWTTGPAADTTAPTVTVTSPAALATNVPVDKKINATFSEAMGLDTMTTANFTLVETGIIGNILGTVAYDVQNNIATFSPQSNLKPDTGYTVTVTNGAKDLAGNALVVPAVNGLPTPNPWTFRTAATPVPPAGLAINLRGAASFGIASRAGLTSTGVTVVNGDVALYPLGGCTDSTGNAGASQGCLVKTYSSPTGMTVNGSIYWAGDPFDNGGTANSVTNDLNVAWTEGMNKVDTLAGVLLGQLGAPGPVGKIILPGVYNEANLGFAAGMVATFDAQNDANAIFVIKVGTIGGSGDFVDSGTLLLPTQIKLVNGAQARNIWFVVGRDITIGSGTTWNGNILAGRTASILDGSTVVGRVLAGAAGAGAITLTGAASPSVTTISVPQ